MSNWTPCDNTSSLVSSHYSIDHTLGSWTLTPHLLIIFIIPATLTIVPLFLVTISSYFPVTPLWHKELHHTQDHIGNSALYWVSFPAVFMPSGPASGWPLASSPLCLWRASVHRASLHFRHLLCLQTSSSNTTVSPILVTVWSWHLPARSGCLLLTEKLPTSCQTPTAHYVLHGEPQCTSDVQRKGHTPHTYTAGWPFYSHSRSTKPYSCPKPIASSCREPTESTSWTFRTRPPSLLPSFTFYNFYLLLLLIFSSTHATLYLPLDSLLSIPSKFSAHTQNTVTLSQWFQSLQKGRFCKPYSTSLSLQWPAVSTLRTHIAISPHYHSFWFLSPFSLPSMLLVSY